MATFASSLRGALRFMEGAAFLAGEGQLRSHTFVGISVRVGSLGPPAAGAVPARRPLGCWWPCWPNWGPIITSTDRPLVLRALAFYRRLKVQVTLRYDDTVHLGPHRCQLSSGGLWALLARAKTSGAGPLPVFAAAFCGVVDSRWLARGWQALLEATPWGRGYLLPGLQGDTATGVFASTAKDWAMAR